MLSVPMEPRCKNPSAWKGQVSAWFCLCCISAFLPSFLFTLSSLPLPLSPPTISFLRSRNLLGRMMRSMWQWVSASTCRQSIDLVSHLPCFPTYVQTLCTICQVGLILGGESYVADLAYDIDANPALFQENVRKLAERVRMICRRLWSIDFTFYILLV